MQPIFRTAEVLDLLLNRDNPRHVAKHNQADVIEYLLSDEEVYNLARHMSEHGVNPLEVVAVFPDDDGNLVVAEGNRRVCAAQLLTDPAKAPESSKARFRNLAAKGRDVSQVNIAVFPDYETAQPWLQVLHDGEQDGVGRRRWKPEQKARATTAKSTDALAVALLDYAEAQGILDATSRGEIRLSTATRYLANPSVRAAMGVASAATSDRVVITTSPEKFRRILERFVEGIRTKRLHSRSVTKDWVDYARAVEAEFEAPKDLVEATDVTAGQRAINPAKVPVSGRVRIVTPDTSTIPRSPALIAALNDLASFKLSSLYKSLVALRLDEHPALLTTGAWVFLETLTALHGRQSTSDFVTYIASRWHHFAVPRERTRDLRLSLEYISQHGNSEKHSPTFTMVDARNLSNHFKLLEELLVILVRECAAAAKTPKP